MRPSNPRSAVNRRQLLAAMAALVPLSACAKAASDQHMASTMAVPSPDLESRFAELEQKYEARLGVYVPGTDATAAVEHRGDERFAFCSTFKGLLGAAVLHRYPIAHLGTVITYNSADIRSTSPITEQHLATGMSIGGLCDATIRYSDGTAANLLLQDIGGIAAFNEYLRSLGDSVSRLDQMEPELNRNPPGDVRDTTTPHTIAMDYQQVVLGDALLPEKRDKLIDWLGRSTTGAKRIRAGFPADWRVIDKTGSGEYGRANDVAVVWSPGGTPYVVAIMTDRVGGGPEAPWCDPLVADAAKCVADVLAQWSA
ncbi:Beta-lactamase precursor [Mycobacterium marinum]|uniref:class A beta-lactamase n=1 Tax=Mycobacterium marinum TaxID=1781 RepID=UPI000E3DC896|nr:class A beta-lactamase [Mycobacterium marinum]RFZ63571.1 Beta-lactamase precursor [Mycobacterium marinum]